jgi:nucleotide-binding universal stress UspA family protein
MKLLVPVLPSERFYDAVVKAADLISQRGGVIHFLFTASRPPQEALEADGSNTESASEVDMVVDDDAESDSVERWRQQQVEGLEDARQLLFERGVEERSIDYHFADDGVSSAQAIADEAAAGGYDAVVLAGGYLIELPGVDGSEPSEITHAVQELGGDGVRLVIA